MSVKMFRDWAGNAAKEVRFFPDREAVRQELEAHMEDRREDFLAQAMSDADAELAVLYVMGDAKETGKLLNKAHSPLLGWAWLASKICCILLICALPMGLLWSSHRNYGEKIWAALVPDDPCMLLEYHEKYNVPYTELEDTIMLQAGAYSMRLDHGFYVQNDVSYSVNLGWQVWSWQPWLAFPAGLTEMTVEDSFGNVYSDETQRQAGEPHAEFYFNTTGALLPVWRFHVEVLYLPDWERTGLPQWLKFSIPNTDAEFMVYLDGEVRS